MQILLTLWFPGTYPHANQRRSLNMKVDATYGTTPTYIGSVLTDCYEDVCPPQRVHKSSRSVTLHHTEVTMEYFAHSPKSGCAASTGLQCIKTQRCSSTDAISASYKATSVHATPCHYTSVSKSKILTYGELTLWGHSRNQATASTSL